MGGGSWKVTGSDGSCLIYLKGKCSNRSFSVFECAYRVNWPEDFMQVFEGSPLKNIAISCLNKRQKVKQYYRFGLEGNAIYALSPQIRRN
jgi:predicted flavoprotein YhiN